jgi:hypothetical protein
VLLLLLLLLLQVDIIFDDTYSANSSHLLDIAAFKAAYGLTDAQAADIPAIADGQVWTFNNRLGARNEDGSVGSDWFEGSVARPDLVSCISPSLVGCCTFTTAAFGLLTGSACCFVGRSPRYGSLHGCYCQAHFTVQIGWNTGVRKRLLNLAAVCTCMRRCWLISSRSSHQALLLPTHRSSGCASSASLRCWPSQALLTAQT